MEDITSSNMSPANPVWASQRERQMGDAIQSWDQVEKNRKYTDRKIESNIFLSTSFASLI